MRYTKSLSSICLLALVVFCSLLNASWAWTTTGVVRQQRTSLHAMGTHGSDDFVSNKNAPAASKSAEMNTFSRRNFAQTTFSLAAGSIVWGGASAANADLIKELDMSLPSYGDIKSSSASVSNVESLSKPLTGVIGKKRGGSSAEKPKDDNKKEKSSSEPKYNF